jgi:hypothetical protein
MLNIFGLQPRCGSTSIIMALKESGGLKLAYEPYNPDASFAKISEGKWKGRCKEQDVSIVNMLLNKEGYDGLKTLRYQLSEEHNEYLFRNSDNIFIYRRNTLDVAWSNWISANYFDRTGIDYWAPDQQEKPDDFFDMVRDEIPPDFIKDRYNELRNYLDKYLKLAEETNTYVLCYEDFFENPVENFKNICAKFNIRLYNDDWIWRLSPANKFNKKPKRFLIPNIYQYDEIGNERYQNFETWNDKWVVEDIYNHKTDGYFVDLGAFDIKAKSSVWVLESYYKWSGIRVDARNIPLTTPRCKGYNVGVGAENKQMDFLNCDKKAFSVFPEMHKFGTKVLEEKLERHNVNPVSTELLEVRTLESILKDADAPEFIEYLSMDIEGAEYEALRNFPFDKYTFGAISIEYAPQKLHDLLVENNYIKVENPYTTVTFEHYYVHKDTLNEA